MNEKKQKSFFRFAIQTSILSIVFTIVPVSAQAPCSTFACDTMIIRGILDSSDRRSWLLKNYIDTGNGRVIGFRLRGVVRP